MEGQQNNTNPVRLNPAELLEQLKITTEALHKESTQLNSNIPGIDKKLKETGELIAHSLKELRESVMDIRVGISPEDLKKLESYKDYFKHYKPVLYISLFVMLSGWGLAIFGAYSGIKYYKESVRTKQEIRGEVLQEINQDGNVIVERQKWSDYKEQSEVLKAWQKSNPRDSESLTNYFKGYQEFKKGKE
ncbi:hypothetical protein B0A69_22080 [Chryseobacterium shigense]|uniref:Uncharacterized protein n=1 Tax=Chryseobacterium shigense TaxID=297244 RepID=A0A1N7KMI3_9FLAO|nr:hypothetical protein [Chryseobacterium shigense]PQA89803.1 hypothetical protein B0A69_22080 [Chryseobacterium shigense]SIS62660.1 hypothetical protein SAMN05421639_1144 [Chryseobacterium shigense]